MNPETHTCPDCGFKWLHGKPGDHSCTENLLARVKRLNRDWKLKNRIIELLILGEFVKREKVDEARRILCDME